MADVYWSARTAAVCCGIGRRCRLLYFGGLVLAGMAVAT